MKACLCLALIACSVRPRGEKVEVVGEPLGDWRAAPAEAYARNLWDLQAFDGRLYIGYGDLILNTGPTGVIAYDPARGEFVREYTQPEEAIMRYRRFGAELYVVGADPQNLDGGDDGFLYVRAAARWRAIPLPHVIHGGDVRVLGSRLCVTVMGYDRGGEVRCSKDVGATWTAMPTDSARADSLFELGGALYVSTWQPSGVRRIGDDAAIPVAFDLPGVPDGPDNVIARPETCGGGLLFLANTAHLQWPFPVTERHGVFRAEVDSHGAPRATRVAAEIDGVPADLFEHDGRCYVVTNEKLGEGRYRVALYESSDRATFRRRARFDSEAAARSGEILGSSFYVGTGCDGEDWTGTAGKLLRVTLD